MLEPRGPFRISANDMSLGGTDFTLSPLPRLSRWMRVRDWLLWQVARLARRIL